jgi:hypothetical protein
VIDEYNGLLVENYNVKSSQLPLTVWLWIESCTIFVKKMQPKVAHLSLETISKQWESILH